MIKVILKFKKLLPFVGRVLSSQNISNYFHVLDIIITVISYFLAYWITNSIQTRYFRFTIDYVYMLLLIVPTWAIILSLSKVGEIPRTRTTLSIFFKFLNFNFFGAILIFLYKHILGFTMFSHYFLISFTIINMLSLFIWRMMAYRTFKFFRANGHNIHNVIIYADKNSGKFIDSIIYHKEWGFRILMIISDSIEIRNKFGAKVRVLPEKIGIKDIIKVDIIDEVIYCKEQPETDKIYSLIRSCEEIGVIFRLQSGLTAMSVTNAHITYLENIPFLTFMNTPKNRIGQVFKSFMDFWISFGFLFLLSPFMLLISLAIKLTSDGPVVFKQERVGLRGRKFYIYKFRTMVQNAEELKRKLMEQNESDGPTFKIKRDPRITAVGRVLRKTGLDELPQLFNVMKGEMSLIGPRPPLPDEVEQYERWQLRRLSVKPGITCTWQIIPNRNDVLFEKWMKLDIQYIENWSIKADFVLFLRTILSVFKAGGH